MLTEQLTADAAALHQAILCHGGEVSPFFCGKELGWEHRRIARAVGRSSPRRMASSQHWAVSSSNASGDRPWKSNNSVRALRSAVGRRRPAACSTSCTARAKAGKSAKMA